MPRTNRTTNFWCLFKAVPSNFPSNETLIICTCTLLHLLLILLWLQYRLSNMFRLWKYHCCLFNQHKWEQNVTQPSLTSPIQNNSELMCKYTMLVNNTYYNINTHRQKYRHINIDGSKQQAPITVKWCCKLVTNMPVIQSSVGDCKIRNKQYNHCNTSWLDV